MTAAAKHTPTPRPWRHPKFGEEFCGAVVVRKDGFLIADCNVIGPRNEPSTDEMEANADLIVLAVNCHDTLLTACQDIVVAFSEPIAKLGNSALRESAIEACRVALVSASPENSEKQT